MTDREREHLEGLVDKAAELLLLGRDLRNKKAAFDASLAASMLLEERGRGRVLSAVVESALPSKGVDPVVEAIAIERDGVFMHDGEPLDGGVIDVALSQPAEIIDSTPPATIKPTDPEKPAKAVKRGRNRRR